MRGYCPSPPPAVFNARWPSEHSATVWATISAICQIGYVGGSDGPPNATCIPGKDSLPGAGTWKHTHGNCLSKYRSNLSFLSLVAYCSQSASPRHQIIFFETNTRARRIIWSGEYSLSNWRLKYRNYRKLERNFREKLENVWCSPSNKNSSWLLCEL